MLALFGLDLPFLRRFRTVRDWEDGRPEEIGSFLDQRDSETSIVEALLGRVDSQEVEDFGFFRRVLLLGLREVLAFAR